MTSAQRTRIMSMVGLLLLQGLASCTQRLRVFERGESQGAVAADEGEPSGETFDGGTVPPTAVAVGGAHSCALIGGVMYCWGRNNEGQLGIGVEGTARRVPIAVENPQRWTALSLGEKHSCALTEGGQVYCWGSNDFGQLGDDSRPNKALQPVPVPIPDDTRAVELASGSNHVCAVMESGRLYCWGLNQHGQLASEEPAVQALPARVGDDDTTFSYVLTGQSHTCAVDGSGLLLCAGLNTGKQLGLGAEGPDEARTLLKVDGLANVQQGGGGLDHTCAVDNVGALYCWGVPADGRLGLGPDLSGDRPIASPVTVRIASAAVQSVSVGTTGTCAITDENSTAYCWGRNDRGQLGLGHTETQTSPTPLHHPKALRSIALGASHMCAVDQTGRVWCTGDNSEGQLGNGSDEDTTELTVISLEAL